MQHLIPAKQTLAVLKVHAAAIASPIYSTNVMNLYDIAHHVYVRCQELIPKLENNQQIQLSAPKKSFISQFISLDVSTIDILLQTIDENTKQQNKVTVKYNKIKDEPDLDWLSKQVHKQLKFKNVDHIFMFLDHILCIIVI